MIYFEIYFMVIMEGKYLDFKNYHSKNSRGIKFLLERLGTFIIDRISAADQDNISTRHYYDEILILGRNNFHGSNSKALALLLVL